MTDSFKILIADPVHDDGRALLVNHPRISVDVAAGLDEAGLIAKIPGYDALIVRSKSQVTRPVIAAGTTLKAIGRAGIGVDNIDVAAATERGIVVFNTPDANATTTAELTLAHLMSLSRHLPRRSIGTQREVGAVAVCWHRARLQIHRRDRIWNDRSPRLTTLCSSENESFCV